MTKYSERAHAQELKPRIKVIGAGGAGGNAVNNMIQTGLQGCEFVVANTDAQALASSQAEHVVQMGVIATEGLGAGSRPEIGRAAAEEALEEIKGHLKGAHMVFITAGMGGGTGTGAAPVIAQAARDMGVLTVGVVTKPFQFEGRRRMQVAEAGIQELQGCVDTLIVIPNQNLFRIANAQTTFADAFAMADQVLYSGVACVTDLMVKEGLINLDFADVRSIMHDMGKAMMGTGEASGEGRAKLAAEAAIANPLLDETSMQGAKGLLISITGGKDLTLFEVDEAATRIREEVDVDANIILGATFDEELQGVIRVSVVATGIDRSNQSEEAASYSSQNYPQNYQNASVERVSTIPQVSSSPSARSPSLTSFSAESEAGPFQAIVQTAGGAVESAPILREGAVTAQRSPLTPVPTEDPDVTIGTYAAPYPSEVLERSRDSSALLESVTQQAPQAKISSHMPRPEDFPPIAQNLMNQVSGTRTALIPAVQDEGKEARGFFSRFRERLIRSSAQRKAQQSEAPSEERLSLERDYKTPQKDQDRELDKKQQASHASYVRAEMRPPLSSSSESQRRGAASLRHEEDVLEIPAFLRSHAR